MRRLGSPGLCPGLSPVQAFLGSLCTPVSSNNFLFPDQSPARCGPLCFSFPPWECLALPYPPEDPAQRSLLGRFPQCPRVFLPHPRLPFVPTAFGYRCLSHRVVLYLCTPLSPPTLAPEALVILGLPGQCVAEQARDVGWWIRTWPLKSTARSVC